MNSLVFDLKYIQFKPKKAGVPSSCTRIRNVIKLTTPGTFQPSLLASQILVLLTAQLELLDTITDILQSIWLRKGRCPISTVSRWICTTLEDSHATLQKSKSIPRTAKAHEVHTVATSLQLFNKVDLQAMMKAGKWTSRGIFTSFYLRDLCPQADRIRKAGPVVAAAEIVLIFSS